MAAADDAVVTAADAVAGGAAAAAAGAGMFVLETVSFFSTFVVCFSCVALSLDGFLVCDVFPLITALGLTSFGGGAVVVAIGGGMYGMHGCRFR